jgi:hypothetical protein
MASAESMSGMDRTRCVLRTQGMETGAEAREEMIDRATPFLRIVAEAGKERVVLLPRVRGQCCDR